MLDCNLKGQLEVRDRRDPKHNGFAEEDVRVTPELIVEWVA